MTTTNLKAIQGSAPAKGDVRVLSVQIGAMVDGTTAAQKPFLDVTFADHSGSAKVKIWGDSPAFDVCKSIGVGGFVQVEASFSINTFGLNMHDPMIRALSDEEKAVFLGGTQEQRDIADRDWEEINDAVAAMQIQSLKKFCEVMLAKPNIQTPYRRAAAAKKNHHARRGGLVAHTASMLRAARALAPVYGANIDILSAGVIFHDLGKILENDTADGFAPVANIWGEALGHIMLGAQIVAQTWKECAAENPALFGKEDLVRLHLLHMIASHHGSQEFGSPVCPKTPEAFILHYVDNLDARIEMLRDAYAANNSTVKGIFDAGWPLKGTLLAPLPMATQAAGETF